MAVVCAATVMLCYCGGGSSPAASISSPLAPAPTISALQPPVLLQGASAQTLHLIGTNFAPDSTVAIGSTTVTAAFQDSGHLSVTVPVSILQNPGAYAVEVNNPGIPTPAEFAVTVDALPQVNTVDPPAAAAASTSQTVTVTGSNFAPGVTATLNGGAVPTTRTDASHLALTVSAAQLAPPGRLTLVVTNSDGGRSLPVQFTVMQPITVQPVTFSAVREFFVALEPRDEATYVAAADFNGDGKPDLLAEGQDGPRILLGDGQGNLADAVLPAVANLSSAQTSSLLAVAAGDVNGDGAPDIVAFGGTTCPSGQLALHVLINSFPSFTDVPGPCVPGIFPGPGSLIDLDGNSTRSLLLVVENSGGGGFTIDLLQGLGGGVFGAPQILSSDVTSRYLGFADLSGSGRQDIVYSSATGTNILVNHGGGQFTEIAPAALAGLTGRFAVGDFDGDGHPDLLVQKSQSAFQSDPISFFHGNGDGTFAAPKSAALPISGSLDFLTAGDFNGDGHLDVVGAFDNNLAYLLGNGDGTFSVQTVLNDAAVAISTADFNGDGIQDVSTVNRFGTVSLELGGPGKALAAPLALTTPNFGGDISAAALNPGALPSLFRSSGNMEDGAFSNLPGSLLINQGGGVFSAPTPAPGGGRILVDVDGDGFADLVGTDPEGDLMVWKGLGGGQFASPTTIRVSPGFANFHLVVADLDGDGRPDIVGSGFVAFNNGQLNFQIVPIPDSNTEIVGDFNGDGLKDLVVPSIDGLSVQLLLNTGHRGFDPSPGSSFGLDVLGADVNQFFAVADVNGDGIDDLAYAADIFAGNAFLEVRWGQAGGVPLSDLAVDLPTTDLIESLAAVKPAPATLPALLAPLQLPTSMMVFNPGVTGGYAVSLYALGQNCEQTVVADFNGDGHPDIACVALSSGFISVLFGK